MSTEFTKSGEESTYSWPPPPTYERYTVTGDMAVKVRVKMGADVDDIVEIEIKTSITGYSEWTWWHEYEFTLYLDGDEVFSSDDVSSDDEGNMLKFLVDWLG